MPPGLRMDGKVLSVMLLLFSIISETPGRTALSNWPRSLNLALADYHLRQIRRV